MFALKLSNSPEVLKQITILNKLINNDLAIKRITHITKKGNKSLHTTFICRQNIVLLSHLDQVSGNLSIHIYCGVYLPAVSFFTSEGKLLHSYYFFGHVL